MAKLGIQNRDQDREWNRIIGDQIHIRRSEQGFTQAEVAALVGIATKSFQVYENGVTCPPAHTLYRIGQVLGVGLSYFYSPIRSAEHATF